MIVDPMGISSVISTKNILAASVNFSILITPFQAHRSDFKITPEAMFTATNLTDIFFSWSVTVIKIHSMSYAKKNIILLRKLNDKLFFINICMLCFFFFFSFCTLYFISRFDFYLQVFCFVSQINTNSLQNKNQPFFFIFGKNLLKHWNGTTKL